MITGRQIKAARTMLGWDAEQLANKAKLSRDTVFNIENGKVQARGSSAEKIVQVFSDHGLEFIGDRGLAMRDENVRKLVGPKALYDFLDDVYATVINGGSICVSGVDESLFDKHYKPDTPIHWSRMNALRDKIDMRCILCEGDTNYAYDSYIQYRWMDKAKFDPSPIYAYNHKIAFLELTEAIPSVTIFETASIATAFRKQFDFIWQYCQEPPKSQKKP